MDLVKMIRNIRNIEVLLKNSVMNKESKKLLEHSKKNVINLEEDELTLDNTLNDETNQDLTHLDPIRDVNDMKEVVYAAIV